MKTILKFEKISKRYRLGTVSSHTLSHDLNRWFQMNIRGKDDPYLKISETNDCAQRNQNQYVLALNNISFDVEQGDVLGIIGNNGAGKSTLLKILSKITSPSSGSIRAHGRVASLLEVGTGFHPEMTGLENIYMNGAILGMTKAEITRKLDEIIDFSGVERYISTPVKRYSSGMTVRLGFAIAAHLDPEILVVDEVLAVGDIAFQQKAIGKMQDVSRNQGRTVLFVSHNLGAVQQICRSLCVLKNGSLVYYGNIEEGIATYMKSNREQSSLSVKEQLSMQKKNETMELINLEIQQPNKHSGYYLTKDPFIITFTYELFKNALALRIGFDIINSKSGILVFRSFHDDNANEIKTLNRGSYISRALVPGFLLQEDDYTLSVSIGIHNQRWIIFDEVKVTLSFKNLDGINKLYFSDNRPGIINPLIDWQTRQIEAVRL